MNRVFFSGSISIRILPESVMASVNKINDNGKYEILVGDAAGFDSLLQEYCKKIGFNNVTVYGINETPRNYTEPFKFIQVSVPNDVKHERKRQSFKDERMTLDSDISFVVWDEESTGSYNNIIRALSNNKKVRVFSVKQGLVIQHPTESDIIKIYQNSNGLTATELLNILYDKGIKDFSKVQELNEFLVKNAYVLKQQEGKKIIYKTLNNVYSFDVTHRGMPAGVRFKFDLAEHLISKLAGNISKKGYGSVRG